MLIHSVRARAQYPAHPGRAEFDVFEESVVEFFLAHRTDAGFILFADAGGG